MMHFGTSRRRLMVGAATASLLALYPGARVVRAQDGAAYDLIDLGPFDVSVPVDSGFSITGVSRIGAISESGDVCGRFAVSDERFSPAIWPSTGELRRLKSATLGGEARAINASGDVAGRQQYEAEGGYITRATVWRDGEPTNLPGLLFGDEGAARDINDQKPEWVLQKIREAVAAKGEGASIACFGLTFKPNIDDLRESPAVEIVRRLTEEFPGRVKVVEPHIQVLPPALAGKAGLVPMGEAMEAEICVMLVDHAKFRDAPPPSGASQITVDTRGIWRKAEHAHA